MRTLLTLGHGYSAAALAARLAGWRIVGTTRSPRRRRRCDRPGSSRSTGPNAARSTGRSRRRTRSSPRCRRARTAIRCWRATPGRWRVRRQPGSATSPPRGSTATGRAGGSTRTVPSSRRASVDGAASQPRPPGVRPGCPSMSSGSPESTVPDAVCSTVCAPGTRGAWFARARFSAASTSPTLALVLDASLQRPEAGTCLQRLRRPALAARGCHRLCLRPARLSGSADRALRDGDPQPDGRQLLDRVEARLEPADQGGTFGRARVSRPTVMGCGQYWPRAGRQQAGEIRPAPPIMAGVRFPLASCMGTKS